MSVCLAVIDNDPLSLAALTSVLRQGLPGIQIVWTASSARQALELLGYDAGSVSVGPIPNGSASSQSSSGGKRSSSTVGVDRPQILLTDMSMPDMDGITLTRRIRSRDGRLTILAMTSFPLDEYAEDVAQAGAQGIVPKGRPGEILAAIRALSHRPTLGIMRIGGDNGSSDVRDDRAAVHRAGDDGPSDGRDDEHADPRLGSGLPDLVEFLSPSAAFEREASRRPSGIERFTPTERRIAQMCADGATTQEIADQLGVSAGTVTTHIQRMCAKTGARNRVRLVTIWLEQSRPRR